MPSRAAGMFVVQENICANYWESKMNCRTRLTGYILFATSVFNEKFNIEKIHDIFVGVRLENTVGLCTIACI